MRAFAAATVLAVVISACGGSPASTATTEITATTPGPAATETASPTTTRAAVPSTSEPAPTTASTTATRPRPEGDDAPDFTLALGEGGEFTLSEERKPVYMIFWAEW